MFIKLYYFTGRNRSGTLDKLFRRKSGKKETGMFVVCSPVEEQKCFARLVVIVTLYMYVEGNVYCVFFVNIDSQEFRPIGHYVT